MDGDIGIDLVKGLGHAMGMPVSLSDLHAAQQNAEAAFKAALAPVKRGRAVAEDWERVSPEMKGPLMGLAKFAGQDQLLGELQNLFREIGQSIQKDINLTSPISTGLVPFDLAAPAKLLYPVYSPLRNKIPRVRGQGTSRRFKRINSITGSNGQFTSFFISEFPGPSGAGGGTIGGLNLPPPISLTGVDAQISYAFMGLGNNTSLLAEVAGRGFQDIDALVSQTLMQAFMLQEEAAMLFARTSNLAAPTGLTVTAQTPTGSNTALTGVTTNVFVKVTALSGLGETVGSAAVSAAPTGIQDVLIKWTDVPGATGYNIYVSTGAADPGDGSRFFNAYSASNQFELGGALATSGNTVPGANTTSQSNGYLGMIGDIAANGGSVTRLNSLLTVGGVEFQVAFRNLWNTIRADPDEVWMAGADRSQLSRRLISDGSSQSAYRISYQQDQAGHITGGQVISGLYNEVTGKEVALTVHPWLPQGNALILSYQTPFPYAETPNIWENVMVQDYLGIQFPNIDLARRFAIVQYGALVDYGPSFNGIIQGIQLG